MSQTSEPFSEAIERRARRLATAAPEDGNASILVRGLVREIALVLDQIDTWRSARDRSVRSLLRVECYTDTELMQMEQRTPRYSPYRFPEREKLQRRLGDIEKERRRLDLDHDRSLMEMHNRLFELLERHAQLTAS